MHLSRGVNIVLLSVSADTDPHIVSDDKVSESSTIDGLSQRETYRKMVLGSTWPINLHLQWAYIIVLRHVLKIKRFEGIF